MPVSASPAVDSHPHLAGRCERPPFAHLELPVGLKDEPQARRITFGPEHALDAVGLRAGPTLHRTGR